MLSSFRARQISSPGQLRAQSAVTYEYTGWSVAASGAKTSTRSRTSKPLLRSRRSRSPWAGVKLDARVVPRPLQARPAPLRPVQAVGDLPAVPVAEHGQRRVPHEHELTPRPQQPGRFGDPAIGVAPDRRPVLRDREVERGVGQRDGLRAGLDQLQPEGPLLVEPACGLELRRSDVDADDTASTTAAQPRREVGGAAAELDHIPGRHVWQDADIPLWSVPEAPGDLLPPPFARRPRVRVAGVGSRPVLPIDANVIGLVRERAGGTHAPQTIRRS